MGINSTEAVKVPRHGLKYRFRFSKVEVRHRISADKSMAGNFKLRGGDTRQPGKTVSRESLHETR